VLSFWATFRFRGPWLTDVFDADEDARPLAAKYLVKWRPGFIESQTRAPGGDAAPASGVAIAT
jgi:symplekin